MHTEVPIKAVSDSEHFQWHLKLYISHIKSIYTFLVYFPFKHLLADQIQQYFGSLKLHSSDLDISIQQH